MKYVNHISLYIALIATIAIGGCKKNFLDVNDDPNRVTESNITAELLFPQAAHGVGVRSASLNFTFLNYWVGYWAQSGDFAIDQTQTTYNIDFNFANTLWLNYYDVLFDLYQAKTRAIASGDSVLAGASMILSAKLWQELVDMFGNIPYTEAFHNQQTTQPKYDKAEDIYASLLKSLDSAISFMSLTPRSSFESVDIVNHGDQERWIKFANTLRLRLLIRQSQIPNFNPASEISKILASGGVLHEGEDIMVNPGYSNAANKQSPFYANYGFTPTDAEANTSTRANNYFVTLLQNTNDPRLNRFFRPPASGGTAIVGTTFGLAQGNPVGAQSSGMGPGLLKDPSQDQWIYPAYQSMFLEAEAIARGWMPGDPKAAYEAAVTENFRFLGVPDADAAAADYLSTARIANWSNAGSSPLSQAKFIAYQKYIANAGIDPLESWSDIRRLNMIPDHGYISVNPNKVSNNLPVRLLYPQSEYTTNAANVQAQGSINAFTSKIFWQP